MRLSIGSIPQPGISNDNQSIENYNGQLSGSSRQDKQGVLKRSAGVLNFLKHGITKLAKFDAHLARSKSPGSWSEQFINRRPPRNIVLQALVLGERDIAAVSEENGGGYLVNKTHRAGIPISTDDINTYFLHKDSPLPDNFDWHSGLRAYSEILDGFCHVPLLQD